MMKLGTMALASLVGACGGDPEALPDAWSEVPLEIRWTPILNGEPAACEDVVVFATSDLQVAAVNLDVGSPRVDTVRCEAREAALEVVAGETEVTLSVAVPDATVGARWTTQIVDADGEVDAVLELASADVTWTWVPEEIAGCEPGTIIRLWFDRDGPVTSGFVYADCADGSVSGRFPVGERRVTIEILASSGILSHEVTLEVPRAGGTSALPPLEP